MEKISELVAGFLLNATWQIAVIALIAWICARLLRNVAARYRHALWVAALIMSLALPLWSLLDFSGDAANQTVAQRTERVAQHEVSPTPQSPSHLPKIATPEESGQALGQLLQKRRQPIMTAVSFSLSLSIIYALFVLYRLGTLLGSWRQTRILRQSAYEREIPGPMAVVAARCRAALALRNVPLLCSAEAAAPVTVGAPEPVIIVPERFYATLPEETLVSVLGHEMAHVARRDYALNLIYEFCCLPLSFHPLAKFIKRQIDRTRELACDELVTERLLEPKVYARALVRVASSLVSPNGKAFTLGIVDADNLEERILKLTQKTARRGTRACRLLALTAFSLLFLSCLTISTFSFELRVDDRLSVAGVSSAAIEEASDQPSALVSQKVETSTENQRSITTPHISSSSQASRPDNAQERAVEACEALKQRAVGAIPTLISMLGDDRPTRLLRCWETSGWGPALETFKQPSPGEQAAIALASMGKPAVEPLSLALGDSNPSVRRNAAWAIGELTNMSVGERANSVSSLVSLLDDADEWVRMAAARALGEIRDERAVEQLIAKLSDGVWKVRELAIWALGEMREERAVETLCKLLLNDAEAEVRETAAWALGEISAPQAAPFLNQALQDAELRVREKARRALSEIQDADG